MSINQKAKGNRFERDVCKKLSHWVSGGKADDLFWRSAMSGGRATIGKHIKRKHMCGDISSISPSGHPLTNEFYIECKSYKDLNYSKFITQGTGVLAKIIGETRVDAKFYGKDWMVIAKENGTPAMVWVGGSRLTYLIEDGRSPHPFKVNRIEIEVSRNGNDVLIIPVEGMELDRFITYGYFLETNYTKKYNG